MGLLDKPSIAEEVKAIRMKRLEDKERKILLKRASKLVKYKRRNAFKRNVSKKLRKEWGERMNFIRSI